MFDNSGQDCAARGRILVEASGYDRFVERVVAAASQITVGDPMTDVFMGPLVSARHRDKVASFIDDSTEVAYRGTVPAGKGFWYPPTVVTDAQHGSRLTTDEIFGPVVAVIPFHDEAEALEIANDSVYGLSGSIWSRDGGRAMRVARALQSGTLSLNSNSSVRYSTPFGGFKQSGLGRELGMRALDHYSELKTIFMSTAG